MNERTTRKHPHYTIEQKNEMIKSYLCQEARLSEIIKQYDIDKTVFLRWVKQYRQFGTTVDGRGKGGSHVGRPKKFDFESMSKEELIQYIKVGEEIKKAAAYLRKQKKSIKS